MKAQKTLHRKELATAISLLLSGTGSAALAQDQDAAIAGTEADDDEMVEEVVVYGTFRSSLMSSMETKRDNSSIIEAISAEDLGKLPDVSIADSLARVPGVTVQRLNGRGQVVNIRGLSPDFAGGLLNGREQVSVGDNRGVEFDQYPSELLNQVIVYKTPDSKLIGQGLSGTVDLRTVRPLEYGERALTLDGRYEWLEYDLVSSRDNTGNRFSAIYIDQFADDTVGLLVGYSHATLPNQGKNNNAWGYYVGDGNGNVAVGGGRVWARASELTRDALVLGLDINPNDNFTAKIDAFYSEFEEDQIKHALVMAPFFGSLEVLETRDGIVTEGVYRNAGVLTENNAFIRDADLTSLGANFEYLFDNDWSVNLDLSHSSIDRSDTAELESNGALGGAHDNFSPAVRTDIGFQTGPWGNRWSVSNDFTNLDYSTANALYTTSGFGWGDPNALAPYAPAGQFGYNKVFDVKDDINSFRLEADKLLDLGPVSNVTFGYNFTNREKSRVANEGVITSGVVGPDGLLLTETMIPADIAGVADLSFFMFGDNTSMVAYNPFDLLASGAIQQGAYLYNDILAKSWVVEEDVHTYYVQFDVDTELFGLPLTGNFGVQYQDWDQKSSGQNAIGAGSSIQSEVFAGDDSDSEFLPSLNLTLALTDNQYLRLGAARTLVRPRMDEMRASGTYGYDATRASNTQADVDALIASGVSEQQAYSLLSPWSRNGGNVQLKPWVADAFDLSYELYFQDALGYFSAAYFYKDLKTYIYNQNDLFDFTGLPYTGPQAPQLNIGPTSSPNNGDGGTIDGYEFSLQLYGELLWSGLEGFGINANWSHNDSNIEANGPGSASPLPGLSEDVWSVQLFYERGGFSARVSQRYRDGFVGEVAGFGGARTGSDIGEDEVLDAQVSYEFQSGALEGLSILFQALNINDEPYTSIDVFSGLPTEYQTFGSTYAVGLTYRPPNL